MTLPRVLAPDRRSLLTGTAAVLLTAAAAQSGRAETESATGSGKLYAPLPPLGFPDTTLNITDFGAVGDGTTLCTAAIQAALDRSAVLGGGEVVVPSGRFLTGTIFLHSRTRLRLAQGAVLAGSDDLADYPVTQVRWEGKWIPGHCSLIQAMDADTIAILGPGHVAGSPKVGGVPRPPRTPLRFPALIEPVNCRGVLLDGFSTSYEHMWNIHPTYCDDLVCRNLTIRSTPMGRDGIDVDSCRHVRIDACDISVGDDCIALKSGRGYEGYALARPTEDVLITNCTFADAHWACIGIGSEMSGGVRHVRVRNCRFVHAKTHAIYIKGQVGRGGFIEDIDVADIDVRDVGLGVLRFNFFTSGQRDEVQVPGLAGVPHVADFRFRNVRVHSVPQLVEGWEMNAYKPLDGLVLENIHGESAKGIHLANARNVRIRDVALTGLTEPLLTLANVQGSGLEGARKVPPPEMPPLEPEPAEAYRLR